MTESEATFDRFLRESGIVPRYESGPKKEQKVDFDFDIGENTVFAEVKEVRLNKLDQRITSGQQAGWWGAREGERVVRDSGRIDHTGWGGHFRKAVEQLKKASEENNQTLVVFQSFSLSADMDSTDIALFLFGHHYQIAGGEFYVFRDRWDSKTPPMISYSGFENVSGLAYVRNDHFHVYANPFARVPLEAKTFVDLDRCKGVLEFSSLTRFHGDWVTWEPGFMRLRGKIGCQANANQ